MTKRKKILVYTLLCVVSLISVFPLYFMICAATNDSVSVMRGTLKFGNMAAANLKNLFATIPVTTGMRNSLRNALVQTVLSVLCNAIAGYGFEIYHDKKKDVVFVLILMTMMVPFVAVLVPLFTIFSGLGLLNTIWALLLPSTASAMLVMLFRQAARSFPLDIIDAARVDGVSEIGIFFRMFVPTMKSTFGAAFTVSFMGAWNNFLWPLLIFQRQDTKTMPVLVSTLSAVNGKIDYGMVMMGTLVLTLPTMIIFLLLQRSFAAGITGVSKG